MASADRMKEVYLLTKTAAKKAQDLADADARRQDDEKKKQYGGGGGGGFSGGYRRGGRGGGRYGY